MWRRRQWSDLLWHIDHLPRNSFYHEAMATDEDLARELIRSGQLDDEKSAGRPRVSEFGLTEDLLTLIANELRTLQATVVGLAGGGNPKVPPVPGPEYAITRVKAEERERAHKHLAARLVPHLYPDGPEA